MRDLSRSVQTRGVFLEHLPAENHHQARSVCVFANGPEEETLDIKYAVIGACFGAVFGVIFIVLKLCLLKTKILDSFSDSESFNLRTISFCDLENYTVYMVLLWNSLCY
ncbi:Hypothetical predicted protein [Pelobates cultripes]|uniref:Uncharacterized protein n=1 Tax=Pelobates cultripes TaxID=61616 RepID=A0AAD1T8P4_PELCU|nr:Hypothetical predicted protein [Pelobates cultripes]